VRLLTWNVQWCRGIDGTVSPSRIAAEARRLADPDVACFQEVACGFAELPGSRGEDQPDALAREFASFSSAYGWGVDLPGQNGRKRFGNLVLSRLPMGRVLRHSLPWPAAPEAPSMPRLAVEAIIEAPFGAVRVITTHLEYYSDGQRAAQVERLREVHAEACSDKLVATEAGPFQSWPRPKSALLCGDFNLPPDDPLHERMVEPFREGVPRLVDAWEALHPGTAHPHSFRVHEREEGESPYCCDFVFVTEDLVPRLRSIRVDGATQASDHQPVMVEIG
jgi:endonuclease/exonuclease/phosphatase family metal-dependent hydrolase